MPSKKTKMNWDLTGYFAEFDGPEMKAFKQTLKEDVAEISEKAKGLKALDADNAEPWEAIFLVTEDILRRYSHIGSYIGCLASIDAHSEAYRREEAEMALMGSELQKLENELLRALKEATQEVFSAFAAREAFEGARYFLERSREKAQKTMSPAKEELAADLAVDGLDAWGRLYDTLSGQLEFDMEFPDGRRERLPMSQRRSLMDNPDRRVRQAAFEGGNAAWASIENVAAAAMNAISGARLTLYRHRGIEHFLEVAMFDSAVTQKSIDAMFEAIFANLDVPLRALRLRAKAMELPGLAWYDLAAPMPLPNQEPVPWKQAKELIHTSFAKAYPALADYVQSMYKQKWIEWEPRTGKRPGGFCTGSLFSKESRIFMTYNKTLGDVRTLAHEAGHAFHHHVLRDLRPYAHDYPMTLAESASTFGEMVLTEGILGDESISDVQKALILDMEIGHGAIYLMDIPVRYEFEKALYEERARGELSVSRMKELMIEMQQRVFGDVLQPGGEDPYFWASKLHFYITGTTFYNFPYTFGFLLSRGLYARFKEEGAEFLPKYEQFLRLTGSDTAVNVAKRSIGENLESPRFWAESVRSLEKPLNALEALLPKVMPMK